MSRTHRPILDVAAGNLMVLIARHQDGPCPSNAEIFEWTGVPRRRIAAWLLALQARGLLEVEHKDGRRPRRRRLRAAGGVWTGWTQRGHGPYPGSRRARAAAARLGRTQRREQRQRERQQRREQREREQQQRRQQCQQHELERQLRRELRELEQRRRRELRGLERQHRGERRALEREHRREQRKQKRREQRQRKRQEQQGEQRP